MLNSYIYKLITSFEKTLFAVSNIVYIEIPAIDQPGFDLVPVLNFPVICMVTADKVSCVQGMVSTLLSC